jgi:putative FmdB family regulatory protein
MVMIYEYVCTECKKFFDVFKPVAEFDSPEFCSCGLKAKRLISGGSGFIGAKVEDAVFDPAFGKVIRNSQHRRDEAKARGWIEVGTENPDKINSAMDKTREENRINRWEREE